MSQWSQAAHYKRTCVKNSEPAGCSSVIFSTTTSGYSKVCGKISAYQVRSTGAFGHWALGQPATIDTPYVDGVSLTHGNPRQHLWTFSAAQDETTVNPRSACPCTNINTTSQAFRPRPACSQMNVLMHLACSSKRYLPLISRQRRSSLFLAHNSKFSVTLHALQSTWNHSSWSPGRNFTFWALAGDNPEN